MLPNRKALDHEMQIADQIQECMSSIRKEPTEIKHRVALAQLYMASRQWSQASAQLERAAHISPSCIPLAGAYCEAIRCEMLREKVFAGERLPATLESAPNWVNTLASCLQLLAANNLDEATQMREQAFDEADACPVEIDGQPGAWISDADSRLGPVCELFMDGDYYWVPFSSIARLDAEPPTDLRDLIWLPCAVQLTNGQNVHALMPARYPGEQDLHDEDALLCRKTGWTEIDNDAWAGSGQKVLISDNGEYPILSIRTLVNPATPTH